MEPCKIFCVFTNDNDDTSSIGARGENENVRRKIQHIVRQYVVPYYGQLRGIRSLGGSGIRNPGGTVTGCTVSAFHELRYGHYCIHNQS